MMTVVNQVQDRRQENSNPRSVGTVGILRIAWPLISKELRELLPWFAMVFVAMVAGLAHSLMQVSGYIRSSSSPTMGETIVSPLFLTVMLFVPPAGACLFGLLQFLRETPPDRFAFLVHRPVNRSSIFWCKVVAGMVACVGAIGIPFVAAVLWAKDPQRFPMPFRWEMSVPGLVDCMCGVPYYFAGALIARRTDARWFGSRLLVLGIPFVGSVYAAAVLSPWHAIIAVGVATGVLAAASYGAFQAGGQYRPQPAWLKSALGACLLVTICCLGYFVIGAVRSVVDYGIVDLRVPDYTVPEFLKDGTPVRVRYHEGEVVDVRDLDGKVAMTLPARTAGSRAWELFANLSYLQGKELNSAVPFQDPARYFSFVDGHGEEWWFRHGSGDYLVGYGKRLGAKALIGSIGPAGLERGRAVPSTLFSGPMIWFRPYFANRDTLYKFSDDELVPVFHTPDHAAIERMVDWTVGVRDGPDRVYVAIATAMRVYIFSDDQGVPVKFSYPRETRGKRGGVAVTYLAEKNLFLLQLSHPSSASNRVIYIRPDGTLEKSLSIPRGTSPEPVNSLLEDVIVPAVLPPVALAAATAVTASSREVGSDRAPRIDRMFHYLWYALIISSILMVCTFVLRYQRDGSMARASLWGVLVLLLGPAGLLTMWALLPRPFRARCPACGEKRPVTDVRCGKCGEAWPSPKAVGTEIFVGA